MPVLHSLFILIPASVTVISPSQGSTVHTYMNLATGNILLFVAFNNNLHVTIRSSFSSPKPQGVARSLAAEPTVSYFLRAGLGK